MKVNKMANVYLLKYLRLDNNDGSLNNYGTDCILLNYNCWGIPISRNGTHHFHTLFHGTDQIYIL